MLLSPGARLGPYEVLGPIGAGGMGEVYRARDTRLDRTVAVKVLAPGLAANSELKARFEREARVISGLAHPNICTLHDVGEQDGRTYLVMEYLAGETLAERLRRGPLPLGQALDIARQVADALSAAHRKGVIHRDLKPANIMLTGFGARLLDFGLARLAGQGAGAAGDSLTPAPTELTSAPTEPQPLTGRGKVVGTLPYMAPEQVEGKPADMRTDLWALGAILYEMLTGERPFPASSRTRLVGAILEAEPTPLRERQPLIPPTLERLVRRCLAKDPDDRWDTAHDVADELRWIVEEDERARGEARRVGAQRPGFFPNAVLFLALGLLAGGVGVWALRARPGPPPVVVRSLLDIHPAEELDAGVSPGRDNSVPIPGGSRTALTWVPGTRALVFVGRRGGVQQLFVRRLDASTARPLEGTLGAQVPAVSPDRQWVAFWADGAIRKVPLSGGPSAVVARDIPSPPFGMSWGQDGDLFLGHPSGTIWCVTPGGVPQQRTRRAQAELSHRLPEVLPGGGAFLFTVRKRLFTWGDDEVVVQTLADGARRVLIRDAADARHVPSGHLVFLRRGVLFAVAFDIERLEVLGEPVPLVEEVAQALTGSTANMTGAGQFAVSDDGSLAFLAGAAPSYPDFTLASVDRGGGVTQIPAPPRSYVPVVRLSPDGRWLAVVVRGVTDRGVWLYDMERGTLGRLTRHGEVFYPTWNPSGERIAFTWLNDGVEEVAWIRADGRGEVSPLAREAGILVSWSSDAQRLALVRTPWGTGPGDDDIWLATLDGGEATLEPLIQTSHGEAWPEFSPRGDWLAYASDDSGRWEVYVQPLAGAGARTQVSVSGGRDPAWNPEGQELFFVTSPDPNQPEYSRMMVARIQTSPTLRVETPHPLFRFREQELMFDCTALRCYDVASDGQRFFVAQGAPSSPPPPVKHIHLVQGWLEEARARVPRF